MKRKNTWSLLYLHTHTYIYSMPTLMNITSYIHNITYITYITLHTWHGMASHTCSMINEKTTYISFPFQVFPLSLTHLKLQIKYIPPYINGHITYIIHTYTPHTYVHTYIRRYVHVRTTSFCSPLLLPSLTCMC